MGSPLHTWRIPDDWKFYEADLGITSTHVENTCQPSKRGSVAQDHLYTRGEYEMRAVRDDTALTDHLYTRGEYLVYLV